MAQSKVHSLYRFVLNPFLLPCVILFHILGHPNWIFGGIILPFFKLFGTVFQHLFFSPYKGMHMQLEVFAMFYFFVCCIRRLYMDNNIAGNIFTGSVSFIDYFVSLSEKRSCGVRFSRSVSRS